MSDESRELSTYSLKVYIYPMSPYQQVRIDFIEPSPEFERNHRIFALSSFGFLDWHPYGWYSIAIADSPNGFELLHSEDLTENNHVHSESLGRAHPVEYHKRSHCPEVHGDEPSGLEVDGHELTQRELWEMEQQGPFDSDVLSNHREPFTPPITHLREPHDIDNWHRINNGDSSVWSHTVTTHDSGEGRFYVNGNLTSVSINERQDERGYTILTPTITPTGDIVNIDGAMMLSEAELNARLHSLEEHREREEFLRDAEIREAEAQDEMERAREGARADAMAMEQAEYEEHRLREYEEERREEYYWSVVPDVE